MERKKQLSNVAFGGDWSEAILVREAVGEAVATLQGAVDACQDEDIRTGETRAALAYLTKRVARGAMLERAFWKAAAIADPALRGMELARCLANVEKVVGVESVGYSLPSSDVSKK